LCDIGIQIGLVIGGGNILRGAEKAAEGLDRVTSDQMGCWQRSSMLGNAGCAGVLGTASQGDVGIKNQSGL